MDLMSGRMNLYRGADQIKPRLFLLASLNNASTIYFVVISVMGVRAITSDLIILSIINIQTLAFSYLIGDSKVISQWDNTFIPRIYQPIRLYKSLHGIFTAYLYHISPLKYFAELYLFNTCNGQEKLIMNLGSNIIT